MIPVSPQHHAPGARSPRAPLLVLFSLWLLPDVVAAQAVLRGRVVDSEVGNPLARATVRIRGGAPLVTDSLGEFVARELASSRVLVIGTYRDVDVSRQHPLSLTLGELGRERLFQRESVQARMSGTPGSSR